MGFLGRRQGMAVAAVLVGGAMGAVVQAKDSSSAVVHLLDRAETLLVADEASGEALLGRVLSRQRGPDGAAWGYARYAHFRLAQHAHDRGDPTRARRELRLALAVRDGQDAVRSRYRVDDYHPLITQHYPEVVGLAPHKTTALQRLRGVSVLLQPQGRALVGVGAHRIALLDRATGEGQTLFDREGSLLRSVTVSPDGRRVAAIDDGPQSIWLVDRDPLRISQIDLPLPEDTPPQAVALSSVQFARDRDALLVVRQLGPHRFDVQQVPLVPPHLPTTVLLRSGRVVLAGSHFLVCLEDVGDADLPTAERVLLITLDDQAERLLFQFPYRGTSNTVRALSSPSGRRLVVQVFDAPMLRSAIIVHDFDALPAKRGRTYHRTFRLPPIGETTAAFSRDESVLLIWEPQPAGGLSSAAGIALYRYDWRQGELPRPLALPPPAGISAPVVYGLGTAADRRTAWLHWGDVLLWVDPTGNTQTVSLTPLSGSAQPRWRHGTRLLSAPDQFFFGLDDDGGQRFIEVARTAVMPPQ